MVKHALVVVSLPVAVAAAVVIASSGTSAPPTGEPAAAPRIRQLLGVTSEGLRSTLVRIDPRTLRPRSGRRVDLGTSGCASRYGGMACWSGAPWSFSGDRSRLAVARNDQAAGRSLRVVDSERLRVTADVPISGGSVGLVSWAGDDRLLTVQEVCCDEKQQLLVIDVGRRRVVARRPLDGTVLRAAETPRELVLLLAPSGKIGTARMAIVDRDGGGVRFVALDRTLAGMRAIDEEEHRYEQRTPGLAVDPQGRHAFVVGPGPIADVDLATDTVAYHKPSRQVSLLGRLRDWLDPVAYAKGVNGPTRSAHWLGGGVLAVAGYDESRTGEGFNLDPAGLTFVDTRSWTARTIDPDVTDVRVAGAVLLATGSDPDTTIGLTAYGFDGRKRFQRFDGRPVWIEQVSDRRAVVGLPTGARGERHAVVDLATGRATVTSAPQPPQLLVEAASSWWSG